MVAHSPSGSTLKPFTGVFRSSQYQYQKQIPSFSQLVLIGWSKHQALGAVTNEASMTGDVTTGQFPQLSRRRKHGRLLSFLWSSVLDWKLTVAVLLLSVGGVKFYKFRLHAACSPLIATWWVLLEAS